MIDYEMNSETRVGTWTIEWGNGLKERMEKDCLLSALELFDGEMSSEERSHHWSGATTWSDSERMTLYRLRQVKGNDWAGIAATGKIPGKSSEHIRRWRHANSPKNYNSLEKAFKDARAKVAKQTETGKLEGTVIDYKMNSETSEKGKCQSPTNMSHFATFLSQFCDSFLTL